MRHLGLGLYAEGPTDYYFLQPLLKRLCEDCCCQHAGSWVEISEVLGLDHPPHQKDASRDERILAAAQSAAGAWQLLFVHADGSNDPPTKHQEQIQPALTLLGQHFARQGAGVAVLPVRETEAWAIADSDALRRVLGSRLSDEQLGLPALARVASTTDPKQVLEQAISRSRGGGRRRPIPSSHYLASLGQEVELDKLRQLDAFAKLEADVIAALRQLGIVR